MMAQINVDLKELPEQVSPNKIVSVYGVSTILGCISLVEILKCLDHDLLLQLIGEEKIHDFLAFSGKKDATA